MIEKYVESLIPDVEKNESITLEGIILSEEVDSLDRVVRLGDLIKSRNIPIDNLKNTIEKVIEEEKD